jgi:2-oxoisovalerate dehydrogenase E1 component alpha subunit
MIWSTRPGQELPVLMVVANNSWGISTSYSSQHAEERVIDRGKAFGIPGEVVDGNDPVASWFAVERAMKHCREERRPYMVEALVSRLHGHSSSSGAARLHGEADAVALFADRLVAWKYADRQTVDRIIQDARDEADAAADEIVNDPRPEPQDIYKDTYADSKVDVVYPGDYDGLPE